MITSIFRLGRKGMSLKRYSKPHGHGDVSGRGLGRLMGATKLTAVELLVRETIQNTWDARLPEGRPEYGIDARFLRGSRLNALREQVFEDLPAEIALRDSLRRDNVAGIEIYDRGTTGLDGPLDPSSTDVDSARSNFVKLVFDIGSTKATGSGSGGTYGFGKTAAFTAGVSGSVVYWTACRTADGEIEHRLIGVSHGNEYSERAIRYTGVHWWGDVGENGKIIPLVGPKARDLGERLFIRPFLDGETGTSILVIDPLVAKQDSEPEEAGDVSAGREYNGAEPVRDQGLLMQLRSQIAQAAAEFAWPKVTPSSESVPAPMNFRLGGDDAAFHEFVTDSGELRTFGATLNVLRKHQAKSSAKDTIETVVEDGQPVVIRCTPIKRRSSDGRYLTIGDLAVAKKFNHTAVESGGSPLRNRLCNMRHAAELVVEYVDDPSARSDSWTWFGVFKPRAEFDSHFSESEPPAHDSWTPGATTSEEAALTVTRAKSNVQRKVREILSATPRVRSQAGQDTVRVASRLRGLVPLDVSDETLRQSNGRSETGGKTKRRKELVTVEDARAESLTGGRQVYAIRLRTADSDAAQVSVQLRVRARTPGGPENLEAGDVSIRLDGDPELRRESEFTHISRPGEVKMVYVEVPEAIALDFTVDATEVDPVG